MDAVVQQIENTATETAGDVKIRARNVSIYYGVKQAIDDISIDVPSEFVTAFIGTMK